MPTASVLQGQENNVSIFFAETTAFERYGMKISEKQIA